MDRVKDPYHKGKFNNFQNAANSESFEDSMYGVLFTLFVVFWIGFKIMRAFNRANEEPMQAISSLNPDVSSIDPSKNNISMNGPAKQMQERIMSGQATDTDLILLNIDKSEYERFKTLKSKVDSRK